MIDPARLHGLKAAVQRIARVPAFYDGYCFRVVKPRFGNRRDALSGNGSRSASGRFHVRGVFLIVYLSCSLEGANWEFLHTARNRGLKVADLLPISTLSVRVRLSAVLDLTSRNVRRALGITLTEIQSAVWDASADETLTQAIGRLAFEAGFEAVLAPSGGRGQNLNIMPSNILPDSLLEIINENELPPPV